MDRLLMILQNHVSKWMNSTKRTRHTEGQVDIFLCLISFNTDFMKILRYVTALLQMNSLVIIVSSSSKFSFPFGNSVVILFFWLHKDIVGVAVLMAATLLIFT